MKAATAGTAAENALSAVIEALPKCGGDGAPCGAIALWSNGACDRHRHRGYGESYELPYAAALRLWAAKGGVPDTGEDIRVGDIYEGKGTHRIRVQILSFDLAEARCLLVRSGKTKVLKMSTIHESYRFVEREKRPTGFRLRQRWHRPPLAFVAEQREALD